MNGRSAVGAACIWALPAVCSDAAADSFFLYSPACPSVKTPKDAWRAILAILTRFGLGPWHL